MFVLIFLLTFLYLPLNNGERLPPLLSDDDVYHTLFGNIGSMEDLFLKEGEDDQPTRRQAPDDDDEDISPDELDLEMPNTFEFHKDNITNHTFDLIDFMNINEQYSDFTKEYKKGTFKNKNPVKNETRRQFSDKNETRRHWLDDPDDASHGESIEPYKRQQLVMVLAQFALHCRYEVGKALLQRDLIRTDKRYKLGYLFNRMRRLKQEQLKQAGIAWRMNWDWKKAEMHAIMRNYERVVHFDVDMRDTANLIKTIFNIDESYDYYVVKKKTDNLAGQDTFNKLKASNG